MEEQAILSENIIESEFELRTSARGLTKHDS